MSVIGQRRQEDGMYFHGKDIWFIWESDKVENLDAFEGHTEAVHFHEETKYKVEMNLSSLLNYGQN